MSDLVRFFLDDQENMLGGEVSRGGTVQDALVNAGMDLSQINNSVNITRNGIPVSLSDPIIQGNGEEVVNLALHVKVTNG
jgi:hypothetical protein